MKEKHAKKSMKENSSKDMAAKPPAAASKSTFEERALELLLSFGLGAEANVLVAQYGAEHVLLHTEAFGARARQARNPAGFIRDALNWELPSEQRRAQRETAEAERTAAARAEAKIRRATHEAQTEWAAEIDGRLAKLDANEQADLLELAETRAHAEFGRASLVFVQLALRQLAVERFGLRPCPTTGESIGVHVSAANSNVHDIHENGVDIIYE